MKKLISIFFAGIIAFGSCFEVKAEAPDFAYPVSVVQSADSIMGIKPHVNSVQLIDALTQYSLAKSIISPDNFPAIVSKIDSVAMLEYDVTTKAIIYSLEAEIFNEYYNRIAKWNITSEKISAETMPEDYTEWTHEQFQNKIISLVKASLENKEITSKVKISKYSPAIIYNEYGETLSPSIYDFLVNRSLRFSVNSNDYALYKDQLIDERISAYKGNTPVEIFYILKKNSGKFDTAQLIDLYKKYIDSEYSGLILTELNISNLIDSYFEDEVYPKIKALNPSISFKQAESNYSVEIVEMLNDYKKRYPKSPFLQKIENIVTLLTSKNIDIKLNEYFTSKEDIKIRVVSKNATECSISVYKVPDSFNPRKFKDSKLNAFERIAVKSVIFDNKASLFKDTTEVSFSPLAPGRYIFSPTFKVDGKEILPNYPDVIKVSDIKLFAISKSDAQTTIFATNATTGTPLKNVTISFSQNDKIEKRLKTDSKGMVTLNTKDNYYTVSATKNNDKYAKEIEFYSRNSKSQDVNRIDINTDLAVYRPGEKVNFVGIIYSAQKESSKVVQGIKCEVRLRNVNSELVDSLTLTSDEYGRVASSFTIPKYELLGTYSIEIATKDNKFQNSHSIEVAAYKLPSFEIAMAKMQESYAKNMPVTVSGKVATFSGVPLSDTDVTIEVKASEWMPWMRYNNTNENVKTYNTKTGSNGDFNFTIPQADLSKESFYTYTTTVSVTSLAGETQRASEYFHLGEKSLLSFTENTIIEARKDVVLPITLFATSDKTPICYYSLKNKENKIVKSGEFVPQKSLINLADIISGTYTLSANIDNDSSTIISTPIVIYRNSDKASPTDTPLWIPERTVQCADNGKATFKIGNKAKENNIYYYAYYQDREISSGWIKYNAGLKDFVVSVPKEIKDKVNVKLIMIQDNSDYNESLWIKPAVTPDSLKMTISSFRDKINAGAVENWKFQFKSNHDTNLAGALVLNVYSKAVDAIAQNNFMFVPGKYSFSQPFFLYSNTRYTENSYSYYRAENSYKNLEIVNPYLNTYNLSFFSHRMRSYGNKISIKGFSNVTDNVMMEESVSLGATMGASQKEQKDEVVSPDNDALNNAAVRIDNIKTALWKPMLETDENGDIEVSFNAPNQNSTWILKAIGYTKNLITDNLSREFITNKPIMVEPNLPRFLRQGDDAVINAVVLNSSDTIQHCKAIVELFNYSTNDVIYSKEFSLEIPTNSQKLCSISWNVPDSISFIGYRIKAANSKFSDGEQSLIPILSSVSPVIESKPFFINPKSENTSISIPKIPADAKVTLEYCNNPVWSCVTALPSIFSNSAVTATGAANTLFTLQAAEGIASCNPLIKQAIDFWSINPTDSVLVSVLEKNPSLKISELEKSPWLNDSQQETLQMQGIAKLFDKSYTDEVKEKMIATLSNLQNSDGGWSWYKQSPSSYYTTMQVLQTLGRLSEMGYLGENESLDEMINRAVKYIDTEVIEQYNRQKNKNDITGFCDYTYVRAFYLDIPQSEALKSFTNQALAVYSATWKKMDISNKAYTAVVLNKYGKTVEAKNILRSISQFAISTPTQGTYWDYLQNRWNNKVGITARILQAIYNIDPKSSLINPVRQWLLLQKQTQNWGNTNNAIDAISAILYTGENWIEKAGATKISLNGKTIAQEQNSEYLGYKKLTLTPAEASGATLSITREGATPAWGALYWQYTAPMKGIKAASTADISITKTLYTVDGNKLSDNATLKVGDKVRVRMVVKNKQNLEYVNIVDERCATAEPVNQISGYMYQNNIGYYQETQDSATNIYIYYLPKGTHILSYDVTITASGKYNLGIATIQCQYAPQFTAHSAGSIVAVE